jgi:hypothetical protein
MFSMPLSSKQKVTAFSLSLITVHNCSCGDFAKGLDKIVICNHITTFNTLITGK